MALSRFRSAALARVTMTVPFVLWLISPAYYTGEPEQARAVANSAPLQEKLTGHDGAPLILIPAGRFLMGSQTGEADERPIHPIELDAFYIDKY